MATRGKITELYDIERIKAQQQEVVGYVDEFVRKVSNTKPIRIQLEGAEKTKDVVKGVTELSLAVQEYNKLANQAATAQAKLAVSESEHAKNLAATKIAQQQKNQATKEEIQLEQAAEGSIKQKQIQLKQLQRTYDELSATQRNSDEGKGLLKSIQDLDKELKQLEGDTGRFQRRVGDYANAFASALTPLQNQLKKVRSDINSGNFGGQQLASLQRQEILLANVTEKLGVEFDSTRQQSRAFQEAVQQIGLEFGHQSAVFTGFRDQVGEGVDALNDIRDSIKLAASDTRQLDKFIGAATAIAGGFSLAQGVVGLFGKENEELQKTLVKVQSVMAILNGLQAIQNELKNKDSVLRKLTGFLIKEETKAIQGQVTAQQASAVATTEAAAATDTAAKATGRWGMALKGIGIGILLTLIPLVSSAMSTLSKSTVKVDKDLEGMGDTALEIADSAIKGLDDEIKNLNSSLGLTPSIVDKSKKALVLLKEEAKDAKVVIPTNVTGLDDAKQVFRDIMQLIKTGNTEIVELTKKAEELQTKIKEAEFLQRLKTADEFLQAEFEANKNAIKNSAELDKDSNDRKLNQLKKNFDERKVVEGEFLSKGKELLASNLRDERAIIQANLELQLSQAKGSKGKIREAEDNANKERIIAERNYQDQLTDLYNEAEKRRRKLVASTVQGIVDITGSTLSKMAQSLDTITGNPMVERLEAWVKAFKEAKKEIVAQLKELQKEVALTAVATFESFVSGSFDRETNGIQDQIDALEEKKQKQIEVANATILSADERERAISEIELRSQKQREALELRQKQVELQKAKFEKAAAVLNVAIDTFQKVAAIKAQAAVLLASPVTAALAPLALAQIPFVILGGALATAGILAQPLPRFFKGTHDAPGGLSWVGDGGKRELVVEPTGDVYTTPATPTIMDIPKHSVIYPDANAVMRDLELVAMGNIAKALNFPTTEKAGAFMTKAIEKKLDKLTSVVANKHEIHIKPGFNSIMALHKYGSRWNKRINEQTKF